MVSGAAHDVDAYCRHWRDSNGHLFALERIEPDPERGPEAITLHGTSSNCTCVERRLQYYGHDGPLTLHASSIDDLAVGYLFGFTPEPQTSADLTRAVTLVMSLTPDEWSHITRALSDDDDIDESIARDVAGAVWMLRQATHYTHPDYEPVRVVHDMVFAGHTDPTLVAAALAARLSPDEAAHLPTGLSIIERAALAERLFFLDAIRTTKNVS